MLDTQKTREREALLRRIRELEVEIAQHERNLREGEARLAGRPCVGYRSFLVELFDCSNPVPLAVRTIVTTRAMI